MRIIDWSSDVCSSDLAALIAKEMLGIVPAFALLADPIFHGDADIVEKDFIGITAAVDRFDRPHGDAGRFHIDEQEGDALLLARSEEHTSELQSLMRISYAVFCLKKKKKQITYNYSTHK